MERETSPELSTTNYNPSEENVMKHDLGVDTTNLFVIERTTSPIDLTLNDTDSDTDTVEITKAPRKRSIREIYCYEDIDEPINKRVRELTVSLSEALVKIDVLQEKYNYLADILLIHTVKNLEFHKEIHDNMKRIMDLIE